MRVLSAPLALVVLLLGVTLCHAQTGIKKPDSSSPPDEVGGKKLAEWIKELKNQDPSVRLEAVKAVQLFGADSRDAVKDLCYLLAKDADVSVRTNVCIAMMNVEVRDGDVPLVIKELGQRIESDQQAVVRFQAALAMGRFAEDAKDAIPQLISASKDKGSFEIRKVAVNSLSRAGLDPEKGADPRVTLALIEASKDWSADVRLEAVMSIGAMGEPVQIHRQATIAAVRARLADRDKAVIVWAHATLMTLEKVNEKEMATLAKYLHADESRIKIHAARAIGMLGKDAQPRVSEIVDLLKDKDPMVVMAAAHVLGELSKKANPGSAAVTALKEVLKKKDLDYPVKVTVEDAIAKINGEVKDKPKN